MSRSNAWPHRSWKGAANVGHRGEHSGDWYADLDDPERVVTLDELEAAGSLYAAVRCADMRHPAVPSVRRSCERCGARVWVDRHYATTADRLAIVCVPCLDLDIETRRR